jgi:hypothetical protein
MILKLHSNGINTEGKKETELVALCLDNNIPTNRNIPRIKEGGGKGKGFASGGFMGTRVYEHKQAVKLHTYSW